MAGTVCQIQGKMVTLVMHGLQQLVTAVDELKDPDCANACKR